MTSRRIGNLTDEDVEDLVARVADRVIDQFYQDIGKSVVKRFYQLVGLGAVAGMLWFAGFKISSKWL